MLALLLNHLCGTSDGVHLEPVPWKWDGLFVHGTFVFRHRSFAVFFRLSTRQCRRLWRRWWRRLLTPGSKLT